MSTAVTAPLPGSDNRSGPRSAAPYRIMVADDSAVIRGLFIRSLEADPDIAVVASVSDGQMALNALQRNDVEIVILDIEMPVMDGLTALPRLIAAKPGIRVLVASTTTVRGATTSLKALAAGAADYIAKPGASSLTGAEGFKRDLVAKVKALAEARRKARGEAPPMPPAGAAAAPPSAHGPHHGSRSGEIRLRPPSPEQPKVIAIGSSTGGPQALLRLLKTLKGVRQPILITQHMPATFTAILAEQLQRSTGLATAEASDGEAVEAGRVYVAPGDFHLTVEADGGRKRLRVTQAPPENFCRPSVDPMLRSLARAYGRGVLCTILTGMGYDGLKGGEAVIAGGGTVIAQDEKTSVVWGMPGAVALAGLCSAVLPLDELGPFISKLAGAAP